MPFEIAIHNTRLILQRPVHVGPQRSAVPPIPGNDFAHGSSRSSFQSTEDKIPVLALRHGRFPPADRVYHISREEHGEVPGMELTQEALLGDPAPKCRALHTRRMQFRVAYERCPVGDAAMGSGEPEKPGSASRLDHVIGITEAKVRTLGYANPGIPSVRRSSVLDAKNT
jgi:hypothetical protein